MFWVLFCYFWICFVVGLVGCFVVLVDVLWWVCGLVVLVVVGLVWCVFFRVGGCCGLCVLCLFRCCFGFGFWVGCVMDLRVGLGFVLWWLVWVYGL